MNRCVEQYARSTSADSSYAVHYYAVGSRDKDVTQIVIKVFDKAFRPMVLAKGDTLKYRWNLTLRLLKWLKEAEEQGKNVHGQAMENVRYLNPDAIELNAASGEIKLGLKWHLLNFLGANNHEIDKYLQQTFTRYNYLAPEVSAEVISDAPAHRSEKAAIFSTCMLINKIIKFSYIINSIGTSEARQADIANAKAMNFGKNARATAAELFTAFNQLDPDMRQQIELEENGMDSELLKIFRETLLKDN
ncbi:hypothetical protein [Pantoea sp. B65]|uniref:hypothetical protein n=1 Tax=Pantoea sp. B65 TaxID=2813359 RepID=UPI0039B64555